MPKKESELKKIVHTALIIAIVIILSNFNYYVPMGGGSNLKLGFTTFFVKIPSLIFGPLYGGIAGGVSDFLGYIVKPNGPYMFPLTLTAVLGGILTGLFYKFFKKINTNSIKTFLKISAFILITYGVINHAMVYFCDDLNYSKFLLSLGEKTVYFTLWFEIAGLLCFFILLVDKAVKKVSKGKKGETFLKLFIVLIIPNLFITTINTFILMMYYEGLAKLGFIVCYIPRLTEELIMTVLQSFVLTYILRIYDKILKGNK